VQAAIEDHKTLTIWLLVGVLLASVVISVFGVGAIDAFVVPVDVFLCFFLWLGLWRHYCVWQRWEQYLLYYYAIT
jgi:hypothetical protein